MKAMKPVDWKHDLAARHARCLQYLGRDRGGCGKWAGEAIRVFVALVCVVAGLVVLWCL